MKNKKRILEFLYCVFFLGNATHLSMAQGSIVPNGVAYAGVLPFQGAAIGVLQNPTNSDYTGFFLKPQDGITFQFIPLLDEGVRTFLVSSNNPVSLQHITAGTYSELTYPNAYVFGEGDPFYLGFYTGYNPFDSHGNYTG